ncbi:30S ribosome-binding factor RbfA [Streptomyces tsukubensis]|uniref:Ribosome-binding factor A n=1 Tax=Streptomyces tsukubensis TaxID=83656 RepID=A0A1V4A588_9ACTN|nr:30S ribosome-binding factor RbfA [Streptomyces tsukubensis]OON76451.1 ribosome-binding factor A [Streptomyces tsukubensis]
MADNARARKLADRIQVVVAETLDRRIKDPRLGFVTITDARVTGDLREATVFYTVYGDDEERAASAAALESAKGVLRTEVGRQTGVRFTPSLAFVPDALPDTARTIDDLLNKAHAKDAEVRQASTGAAYAAGADPYRKPADETDDEDTDTSDGTGPATGGDSGKDGDTAAG